MQVIYLLEKAANQVLQSLLPNQSFQAPLFQKTRKEFEGDFTLVIFPYTKGVGKSPEDTANTIGEALSKACPEIKSYNVIKGFLNIEVSNAYWLSTYNFSSDNFLLPPTGQTILVEYSSPNTNKPLHLGHVRNNLLGVSMANLLQAAGNKVVTVNLVNDRGIHICKSMLAWKKYGNNETPQSSGIKGDHLVGKYYVLFDKYYKEQIAELET
ncbi:MAG: arginine--tRNA ligase, partial [Bacteroidia bacterium]|nr:arginine--tRNA ligase [Bacteroidia bacterium]